MLHNLLELVEHLLHVVIAPLLTEQPVTLILDNLIVAMLVLVLVRSILVIMFILLPIIACILFKLY